MIPIVTPAQMNAADAAVTAPPAAPAGALPAAPAGALPAAPAGALPAAPASITTAALIQRAGSAVAFEARSLMGGTYGRRVLVVSGPGNNGADGAVAAEILQSWGARCDVLAPAAVSADAQGAPDWLSPHDCGECFDLVIDAAFGTGLRSAWQPGPQPSAPVLAVDVPSGIDALTGYDLGSWAATTTLTFAALKPGLLLHPAAAQVGRLEVVNIGAELDAATTERADSHLLEDCDAHAALPQPPATAHKWQTAVRVVAGSAHYPGAGYLTCAAALQAGAGMVAISTPGCQADAIRSPLEAVSVGTGSNWVLDVLADIDRFGLLVVGPGLGNDDQIAEGIAELIASCPLPVVVDADALAAVATSPGCVQRRRATTVLTPHEGEFNRLTGRVGVQTLFKQDRFKAVRDAAQHFNAIVLLKGPTTLIATPAQSAHVYAVTSGSQRLATAGSGDVLTGVIAGAIASASAGAPQAASAAKVVAAAAHWHGRTATLDAVGLDAVGLATATGPDAASLGTASTPLIASDQIRLLSAARTAIATAAQPA